MGSLMFVASAYALTLAEAVQRAAEVNPEAVVAGLELQRAQLDAAESWSQLGITPKLDLSRKFAGGAATGKDRFSVGVGALDAAQWMDAAGRSAQATALRYARAGTTLDAQYAAALLFVSAIEARRAAEAATASEVAALATAAAVRGRITAGLDGELLGKSADAAVLVAHARSLSAQVTARLARLRLARALEMEDLRTLETPDPLPLPETVASDSPWLTAAAEAVRVEKWHHAEALAGWLPKGGLDAQTELAPMAWSVTLSATWQLDGVVGPFLNERRSALAVKVAETQYGALKRDFALEQAAAEEQARAAHAVLEAQQAREALAADAVALGQTRLGAGLGSSIDLLRLQDDLASASAARVAAELDEQVAILDARRVAGVLW